MISSFLDQQKNIIILDRIIVTEDGEDKLITDPEAIHTETNRHFQTCAGSINEEKIIPPNWQQQYAPKPGIDDSIYENLMAAPTYQEWIEVI